MKKYNPDLCPVDYKLVYDHMRASIIGIPVINKEDDEPDYCACCNQPIDKKKLKMNIPINDLSLIGEIFPIYFK